ncbi:hypothetical protein FKM82_024823 [Ascaphus truei]
MRFWLSNTRVRPGSLTNGIRVRALSLKLSVSKATSPSRAPYWIAPMWLELRSRAWREVGQRTWKLGLSSSPRRFPERLRLTSSPRPEKAPGRIRFILLEERSRDISREKAEKTRGASWEMKPWDKSRAQTSLELRPEKVSSSGSLKLWNPNPLPSAAA